MIKHAKNFIELIHETVSKLRCKFKQQLREQLLETVRIEKFAIVNVVSFVVVWLAADCPVALHCGLFQFCLCSGAWRFTVDLHHLVQHLFQLHHCRCSSCHCCPNSISVSDCVSSSPASSKAKTSECCLMTSCTSARNAILDFLHERNSDTNCSPKRSSARCEAPRIFVILTLPSCVSFGTHNVGVAMHRILPAPRRTAVHLFQRTHQFALQALLDQCGCFLLMSTPRSFSTETVPSPADAPFTRAQNSDSPELA